LRTLARTAQNGKSGKMCGDISREAVIRSSAVRGRLAVGAPPPVIIDAGLAPASIAVRCLARRSLFDK